MKTFIRTIYASDGLWETDGQRAVIREGLIKGGFYVLSGIDGSLNVYAISERIYIEQVLGGLIWRVSNYSVRSVTGIYWAIRGFANALVARLGSPATSMKYQVPK